MKTWEGKIWIVKYCKVPPEVGLRRQMAQVPICRVTGHVAYSTSMGYDLHITRRKDWSSSGNDIATAEWLAYVARDPELSPWPENGPYMARWNGKCTYPDPWLDWFQGNVYTKNPDEALILKMVRIAKELRGQVQGDDGEIYRNRRDVKIYRNGARSSVLDHLRNWVRTLRQ